MENLERLYTIEHLIVMGIDIKRNITLLEKLSEVDVLKGDWSPKLLVVYPYISDDVPPYLENFELVLEL